MKLETKKVFVSSFEMQVLSGPRCLSVDYKNSESFDETILTRIWQPSKLCRPEPRTLLKPRRRPHPQNGPKIRSICGVNYIKLEPKIVFTSSFEMQVLSGPLFLSIEYKDSESFDDVESDTNLKHLKPVAVRHLLKSLLRPHLRNRPKIRSIFGVNFR